MAGSYRSLATRVAHYLLYATVGLLAVRAIGGAVPRSALAGTTVVVAAAFAALAVLRYASSPRAGDVGAPGGGLDRKTALLILGGLVVVGAALRGYALGVQSLWFDEALTANAAIALLEVGRPTFPSGETYWRAFPHTLAVAASMVLFGTGEAAARLPSVILGVATIPATYWLGRQVGGRRVGLLAAALLTFLTWEVAWSRQARMYQLFQLLFVLSLALLLRVERNGFDDRRGVAALAVLTVLAAATHQIGYVLLPVGVAFLGLTAAGDGRLTRSSVVGIAAGSVALLVAVELVGFGVSAAFEYVAASEVDYLAPYGDWLRSEFGAVAYLGLIGAALAFYRGRYRAGWLLVLAVAPAAWVLGTRVELFATRYLYFGVPMLLVWTTLTVDHVAGAAAEWIGRVTEGWSDRGSPLDGGVRPTYAQLVVAFGLVALLATGGGFTVVPVASYDLGPNAPQPDFRGAYAHVNEHREPGDVIVAGWTAPGVYYAGGVDYWLAHDLTGTGEPVTVDGVERYGGAEPVRSAAELAAVLESHDRGWIVLDRIAYARQSEATREYIAENATRSQEGGDVIVFRWQQNATAEA